MQMGKLPPSVAKALGYYVYLHIDPRTDEVFYVGKGKGNRALSHVRGESGAEHAAFIKKLKKEGVEPRVEFLIHGLPDEKAAFTVEMAAIDLLGLDALANTVRGHESRRHGRMPLEQVISQYQRKPAKIRERSVLIRINRLYHYGISPVELYDVTRGIWVIGKRREDAEYAFAVYRGIVREVYRISQWLPAGSTFSVRKPRGVKARGRWEFVGTVADEKIRRRYVGRSVDAYFPANAQNPITYVNG